MVSRNTTSPFKGLVFRAHDPRWSFKPTSGEGASLTGGRFNPRGQPTLYLALSTDGAILEAMQGFAGKMQPMLLCAYEVNLERITDLTNHSIREALSITEEQLACPWLLQDANQQVPDSWTIAKRLKEQKTQGILVPSYASGAKASHKNLVLWEWNTKTVKAIDDFYRLPKNQASWDR